MTSRLELERLLQELYSARVSGQRDALCRLFAEDALFRITGSSDGKPIAICARGIEEVRPWLTMLVKTFRLADHEILSMVIEGERAAVHWRASVHSRITGAMARTEFVDLVHTMGGRIGSYVEFFALSSVPC
jgi:ketosteroid isomerase-like protein